MEEHSEKTIKDPQSNFTDFYIGDLGKKYTIIETIQTTSIKNELFIVRKNSTGEEFVFKTLSKTCYANKALLSQEIDILTKLDHPNIIRIYEKIETETEIGYIMEKAKGKDVFDTVINFLPLTEPQAATIILQLISALIYLHSHGICNRDIKLDNMVFVSEVTPDTPIENWHIKLIDFDLSTYYGNNHMTEKCGTKDYYPPEVLQGNYTNKCDIWSAGVVLYMLLSGIAPFNGNENDIFGKILKKKFDVPAKLIFKNVSKEALNLMGKMFRNEISESGKYNRPSAVEVMQHPWLKKYFPNRTNIPQFPINLSFMNKFQLLSPMKKLDLNYLARRADYTEENIKKMVRLFEFFDTDCDGEISLNEFSEAFKKIDPSLIGKEEVIEEIFNSMDIKHLGKLEITQFMAGNINSGLLLDEIN